MKDSQSSQSSLSSLSQNNSESQSNSQPSRKRKSENSIEEAIFEKLPDGIYRDLYGDIVLFKAGMVAQIRLQKYLQNLQNYKNFDVNFKFENNETLLTLSIKSGLADFVFQLLMLKADVTVINGDGFSPLQLADIYRQFIIKRHLLNHGEFEKPEVKATPKEKPTRTIANSDDEDEPIIPFKLRLVK